MPAHDDAISPTLVRHAYARVRQGPGRDFHLPRAIEAIAHEVTAVRQGLLIVIREHHSGPWWASCTTAALQGGIETHLCPRRPNDDRHRCSGMRWQHVQEGHCGVMHGRFRTGIASGLLGWRRKVGGDEYMCERHEHSSLLTRV
jgi:hypothetical protein